jgi:peptide/nickel transport system substrate-binding protein
VEVATDILTVSRRVEAGELDVDLAVPVPRLPELGKKYKVNGTRLFAVPSANAYYLRMNVEQPLFRRNLELRQAVNFALDRPAMLSGLGPPWVGTTTDDYLPVGVPGYVDAHLYPLKGPNLTKAKALALGNTRSGKAVMYTCNNLLTGCLASAQTVKANLEAIGIDVRIEQFPSDEERRRSATRGEPFDLRLEPVLVPWVDPYQYVDLLLDGRTINATENTNLSYFNSPQYNELMDQANALSGSARYAAYGRLAVDLARNAAPMAAVYIRNNRFFVSSPSAV